MSESNATAAHVLMAGPLKPKLMLAAGVLLLTGIIAFSVNNLREESYSVLFANLSDKDSGAIIADLSKLNVPYRFAAGGNAILVPASMVHNTRIQLASQGLPRGANVGFEIVDSQGFGVTQFQERLNYQRGLQGELSRSIESLAAVESARVHLAIPENSGFLRKQTPASASVVLRLYPGQILTQDRVAGIVHLVASSLGNLMPKDVTVIDQDGTLLNDQDANGLMPNATQIAYVNSVESRLSQRVIELLEPMVGKGNVRARVTADIDFTAIESTDETFRPNQGGQPAAVRSQQWRAQADQQTDAQGIPGALTNQPPAAGVAPINGAAQDVQGAAGAAGAAGKANRESIVNYEVDRSVRVTKNSVGDIQRLTAAVVVNHRRSVDEEGNVTYTPLSEPQIRQMEALVRQAIGYSEDRGDSINIMNSPFVEEQIEVAGVPFWKDPAITGLAIEILKHLAIIVLGALTIFKVVNPAMRSVTAAMLTDESQEEDYEDGDADGDGTSRRRQGRLDAVVANDLELPAPGSGDDPVQLAAEEAKQLVQDRPVAVANVVREWVAQE